MDPFIGEIKMFAGNFAPRAWAFCNGQLLPIAQNTALFSILGTIYGGDGRTTFALPDLRGRVGMHPGNGPGLSSRALGAKGGSESNTLNSQQLPQHNHTFTVNGSSNGPDDKSPEGAYFPTSPRTGGEDIYASTLGTAKPMAGGTTGNAGGGLSVNNLQPFTCVNYIICLQGVFPSRS